MNATTSSGRNGLRLVQALVVGAAATASVAITSLGNGTSFWHDECDFLHHRSLHDPIGLFTPHNDHAVAIPAAAYRLVVDVAGTGSYLPFLGLLLIAHVATAAGVFAVLGSRSAWAGLGAAVVLLFLGSGADNLFWAFQVTFVGSTAFGVWGLWAAQRGRWGVAALVLTGSVFCSLVGVAFVAAAAAYGIAARTRSTAWLLLPAGALAGWWLLFARGWTRPPDWAVYEVGSPTRLESWLHVPSFVFEAIVRTVEGVSGLPLALAFIVVIGGTLAGAWAVARGWRPSPLRVAAVVGVVTFMCMVAVVRAQDAIDLRPRFLYVGAVFLLLLVPRIPAKPVWVTTTIVLFALALGSNIVALPMEAEEWAARAAGPLACQP